MIGRFGFGLMLMAIMVYLEMLNGIELVRTELIPAIFCIGLGIYAVYGGNKKNSR